jgi:hypothetical protein
MRALTTEHATTLAFVGGGAITGALMQSSNVIPLDGNIRDVLMVVAAMFGMTMGGPGFRTFSIGFGAAAVTTLVARNFPNLIGSTS